LIYGAQAVCFFLHSSCHLGSPHLFVFPKYISDRLCSYF
jgi:hypothetical protein